MPSKIMERMRKRNLVHHNVIPNRLENKKKLQLAIKSRERYLLELAKKPYFDKLLNNRRPILINLKGIPKRYSLLRTGIKNAALLEQGGKVGREKRDIVFVLDSFRRLRVFSKKTHANSGHPGWVEIRGFLTQKGIGGSITFKERVIHKSERTECENLKSALSNYESDINFKHWSSRKIPYFMKYL